MAAACNNGVVKQNHISRGSKVFVASQNNGFRSMNGDDKLITSSHIVSQMEAEKDQAFERAQREAANGEILRLNNERILYHDPPYRGYTTVSYFPAHPFPCNFQNPSRGFSAALPKLKAPKLYGQNLFDTKLIADDATVDHSCIDDLSRCDDEEVDDNDDGYNSPADAYGDIGDDADSSASQYEVPQFVNDLAAISETIDNTQSVTNIGNQITQFQATEIQNKEYLFCGIVIELLDVTSSKQGLVESNDLEKLYYDAYEQYYNFKLNATYYTASDGGQIPRSVWDVGDYCAKQPMKRELVNHRERLRRECRNAINEIRQIVKRAIQTINDAFNPVVANPTTGFHCKMLAESSCQVTKSIAAYLEYHKLRYLDNSDAYNATIMNMLIASDVTLKPLIMPTATTKFNSDYFKVN